METTGIVGRGVVRLFVHLRQVRKGHSGLATLRAGALVQGFRVPIEHRD